MKIEQKDPLEEAKEKILDLESHVASLRAVCAAYDAVTNKLSTDQFLLYVNAVPEQYRKFAAELNRSISANEPQA